jgi:predicted Rossmann fold nucleotide-binding protein DprA/Smf involved in DNA uptake
MKIIVAGSRWIDDYEFVEWGINKAINFSSIFTPTEIVSGNALGVDRCGEQWAKNNNIPVKLFPANWSKYGKSAGPIRNGAMANYADGLIVIWDKKSSGTLNMLSQMMKMDKPIFVVYYPEFNVLNSNPLGESGESLSFSP